MKHYHNIYTLLASAPVLWFMFVPAVVFIWTGELNGERNLSYMLKCMNAFHKCPKNYSNFFALKMSKSAYFSSLQFNIQHTAIFTLFYLSGVLFNIVIILTTCHTFVETFVIPPAFKRKIRYLA